MCRNVVVVVARTKMIGAKGINKSVKAAAGTCCVTRRTKGTSARAAVENCAAAPLSLLTKPGRCQHYNVTSALPAQPQP